jgi:phosphoribosylformylglycinamidine synthase
VGCVGLVHDVRRVGRRWREGDVLLLASAGEPSLAGSEYQARYGVVSGQPPALDLAREAALVGCLWRTAQRASLVHDVAEGGLAVCLAEMAIRSGVGARVALPNDPQEWFGEGAGRAVIALPPEQVEVDPLGSDIPLRRIGEVGGDTILGVPVAELEEAWRT